jgi:membrane protein YdbS with pleckstrin-like domain
MTERPFGSSRDPEDHVDKLELPAAEVVGGWRRVSPKLIVVELISGLVFTVLGAAATTTLIMLHLYWPAIGPSVITIAGIVFLALTPRRVKAIGYQLREDDLLFRRGIGWQRFVAVPYGRMQLVDITRGPVARLLGLSELKFVTAAASTNVTIPGLLEADAEELRDRLVSLAESRRAGL